jgi:hypothetical protein
MNPVLSPAVAASAVGRTNGPRRLLTLLRECGGLLAVAYALPIAILVIGIPIALLARLVMVIAGALWPGRP